MDMLEENKREGRGTEIYVEEYIMLSDDIWDNWKNVLEENHEEKG